MNLGGGGRVGKQFNTKRKQKWERKIKLLFSFPFYDQNKMV